jgi:hypothetical protein
MTAGDTFHVFEENETATAIAMKCFHIFQDEGYRRLYRYPSKTRINIRRRSVPRVPPGAYPHDRLCGQTGIAPRRSKISTTSKIAPMLIEVPYVVS